MDSDRGDYDEYLDEEENEIIGQMGLETFREHTVFLVDASESMLNSSLFQAGDSPEKTGCTYFSYAMTVIKTFMKSKIFAEPSDEVAVMFYGTSTSQNASNLDAVHTFLKLDLTDASRIREVEELTEEVFKDTIGCLEASHEAGTNFQEALRMGLWAAGQALITRHKAQKRVFLMTNNHDPCKGAAASRASTLARAKELRDAQIILQFLPLPTPGELFDMCIFWQDLLLASRPRDSENSSQESVASEFAYLLEMSKHQSFSPEEMSLCMASMDTLVRKKNFKRRAAARLKWTLVDGRDIAVQVFNLVQPCSGPSHTYVDAISNSLLRIERRLVNVETGGVLTHQDQTTVFQAASKLIADRFPAHVSISRSTVAAVKASVDVGLLLLGFKPRSHLRDYHQASHSSFLRPDEGEIGGSVTAFKALLDAMIREDKVAVCRYKRGKVSDARLVALLPQLEVRDTYDVQVFPEGMHLIHLPFSDDIRCPEKEPSVIGMKASRADRDQVEKATALINALSFPKDDSSGISTFACDQVPNPFLQRAYTVIESRAMGQEVEPWDLREDCTYDLTLPHLEAIEQKHDVIQDFLDSVYGLAASTNGGRGLKRSSCTSSAQGHHAAATAKDSLDAYCDYDWQYLSASEGLTKLSVKTLKVYLVKHQLPVTGKKDELCTRITTHALKL
ncbi:hypothetical protein CEUSTIGMA_g539.t1 [Chlamydomonas eustigma]|uniref:SAP domain-containing protein n=1 Tax=Chlamydomonas eustigma TaxID=1157962 RepID=A0A250WQW4_9CHLO|nr:hypothetical protein CEUSTIGMA_g539.t1 [Chlamydomonas eustigma]|eukprot:GAX73086.1 hypothetical protein CEUSTIGMA_g539.t1 [Chlamydomonas eustigma]